MPDTRPDPDALLRAVETTDHAERGRLKVFFGATAGVGKTYAMLQEAKLLLAGGMDVVAGVVETHGRSDTDSMLAGLPRLPLREVEHRGVLLREFDLDAALERHPRLILIDELAHSNAPGSRHSKRWQDVQELLGAGIDVFTTVNVQHIESLNDVVAQITGVIVREKVPDVVLEQADEVELVDTSPDELLKRLRDGKVYMPAQAERALESFFTKANLTALRELALRKTALQVEGQLRAERTLLATQATWPAAERIIVCIGPGPLSADLVRSAKRLASETHAQWEAVYVEIPARGELAPSVRQRLDETLALAESLGAETATLSGDRVAETLVAYARQRNASKILVGKPTHPQWQDRLRGSLVDSLIRLSGDIDVYVVRAAGPSPRAEPGSQDTGRRRSRWLDYLIAVASITATTGLAALLHPHLQAANLIMLYLLAVVAVALRTGRGPAVLAAVLAVGAFDFCFVQPYLTFAVQDIEYLLTFAVMLLVSLIIASLTFRLREQVQASILRERRTSSLYALSREMASASSAGALSRLAEQRLSEQLPLRALVMLRQEILASATPRLDEAGFEHARSEIAVMQWVLENGRSAGISTSTLPGSEALHLPLGAGRGVLGVLTVRPLPGQAATLAAPDQRHLLEAYSSLIAMALEREQQADAEQQSLLLAERERLRATLLSGISHDLRTPLAGIAGSAETLLSLPPAEASQAAPQLLGGIKTEAQRLARLLDNILELTRLENGSLQIKLELQPLEEVVGSALAALELSSRGRKVELDLPGDLPLVRIDAVLIERVLVNLLDNAVRHTAQGEQILLQARARGGEVEVAVHDRGTGLADYSSPELFQPFGLIDATPDAKAGRTGGLGLSICKAIIDAHGGAISAAARPGGGSSFSFTIPAGMAGTELPDVIGEAGAGDYDGAVDD